MSKQNTTSTRAAATGAGTASAGRPTKWVSFVGSGPGDPGLLTVGAVELLREALVSAGLPADAVQSIDEFGRDGATELMRARGFVDVLIPRGSAQLIQTVVRESTVPVIETGAGVVHVYLDASADARMAVDIAVDAKVSRPSVCNAMETLLVHRDAAPRVLPDVLDALRDRGVTVHGDEAVRALWPAAVPATEEDWAAEYLSLDLAVRVVDSVEDRLRADGVKPLRREGERDGRWVLMDFGDIVVHVQHREERTFYQLERLWKDCPTVPLRLGPPAEGLDEAPEHADVAGEAGGAWPPPAPDDSPDRLGD